MHEDTRQVELDLETDVDVRAIDRGYGRRESVSTSLKCGLCSRTHATTKG